MSDVELPPTRRPLKPCSQCLHWLGAVRRIRADDEDAAVLRSAAATDLVLHQLNDGCANSSMPLPIRLADGTEVRPCEGCVHGDSMVRLTPAGRGRDFAKRDYDRHRRSKDCTARRT